jgi:glucose-1-phosphate thymidylyltransferase
MKVILPVAGTGTRLRPFTLQQPKCLLPLAGKTLLDHIIDSFRCLDVSGMIFVTGYKHAQVASFLEDREFKNARTVLQKNPQGLGEAISLCLPYLNDDEPVLIILGDTLFDADLSFLKDEKDNVLMTRVVDDPRRFGVAVTDADGYVTRLVEKPETFVSDEALVGIYYIRDVASLRASLVKLISGNVRTRDEYQLTDALQMMVASGSKFQTARIKEWLDCGTPETYLETNARVLLKNDNSQSRKYLASTVIPPCHIAPTAEIRNSIVGPNVSLGADAVVVHSQLRDCVIDDRVTLENAELSKSILGNDSEVRGFRGTLLLGDHSKVEAKEHRCC